MNSYVHSRPKLIDAVFNDFRRCWKQLFLADMVYKIVAFVVLTPLASLLFRALLATTGKTVLADQDILFFFLGPVGWLCFVGVGALWLGIVALEQAALMGVLCASQHQQRIGLVGALLFAKARGWSVIQVTARILAYTLLTMAPFLIAAGVVYITLLGKYDINYYLKERPPIFLTVLGIGGVLLVALTVVLLRFFTNWFFALPLVLFENVAPSIALRVSRERARDHRRVVLLWMVGWLLATIVFSAFTTTAVIWFGRFFVPRVSGSLGLLVVAIGVTMILWVVAGLAVNLLSTTSFAAMLYNLFLQRGSAGRIDLSQLNLAEIENENPRLKMTSRRLFVFCVIGITIAIAVGAVVMQSVRLEDHAEVVAHRGSSKSAPENTIAAVEKAIEDGAHWVEIDVQETADGEVVVFHDSDFMKLAGVNLKIWDATMADLKDLDVGSWFSAEFQDQRVPTLGEVLDECKGRVGVTIELKYYGHDEQLEQRVVDIVEKHDMVSSVEFMSLKVDAIKKMKSIRPDWKVGLLMSVSAGDLRRIGADFLAVNASFANRRFVQTAQSNGKRVYVWTVNDAVTMSTMIGRGVDGLITDKPALARSVLEQRAELSPPERLLMELAVIFGVVPEIGQQ